MRITTSDGVGLGVEVAGEGPGLLLVHGFGGAKEDFADHVPVLARDHTVVVFDHRGHGASDKPAKPASYTLERLVALVMMDTTAGPIPGFDASLMEAASEVALTRGKDALKELLDIATDP